MTSLLDADVFIRGARDHYRFSVCPGFWEWLLQAHGAGLVASIDRVQGELTARNDQVAEWARSAPAGFFLAADARVVRAAARVSTWAAGQLYDRQAVGQFFAAADYWLVAHALAHGDTVVTHETSQPQSRRRIKLPDACNGVGVPWTSPFQLLEQEGARFILSAPGPQGSP